MIATLEPMEIARDEDLKRAMILSRSGNEPAILLAQLLREHIDHEPRDRASSARAICQFKSRGATRMRAHIGKSARAVTLIPATGEILLEDLSSTEIKRLIAWLQTTVRRLKIREPAFFYLDVDYVDVGGYFAFHFHGVCHADDRKKFRSLRSNRSLTSRSNCKRPVRISRPSPDQRIRGWLDYMVKFAWRGRHSYCCTKSGERRIRRQRMSSAALVKLLLVMDDFHPAQLLVGFGVGSGRPPSDR